MRQPAPTPTPEPAPPWRPPVAPAEFDRTPTLSAAERAALATHCAAPLHARRAPAVGAARRALARLTAPLLAVQAALAAGERACLRAREALYREMLRRDCAFWAWAVADWLEVLGPSPRQFRARHGTRSRCGRPVLVALAYLAGEVTDLRLIGAAQASGRLADQVFGADRTAAAVATLERALYGPAGLGYADGASQRECLRRVACLALLLARSPDLAAIAPAQLQAIRAAAAPATAGLVTRLELGLAALGLRPRPAALGPHAPVATAAAEVGVAPDWAAWCRAWAAGATRLTPRAACDLLYSLFAVGRWLRAHHPAVVSPEQWDEALALEYAHHVCTALRIGDDASPAGRRRLAARGQLGRPLAPRGIHRRLGHLRRAFADWQDRPHAVGGGPARAIPVRFKPAQALATPRRVMALIRPDPRDIDLASWYKLAYAAATLSAADLARAGRPHYPLTFYRALALLWVTTARRPDELRRLRVGCVRRTWEPAMRDEAGQPLEPADGRLCCLQVPPHKTGGAFWIWIPDYTAEAVAAWERERPASQTALLDAKDRRPADLLFRFRDRRLGRTFLNDALIPLLCKAAGVPERDARGQITAHRGRSTRATLLRWLGVPLGDLAAYLGHANEAMVRHYARTDDTQLALTIKRADERSRLVDVLFDPHSAAAGRPSVFFALGRGPDGQPRYCGNPAWASCPHRLACLKCQMFIGGTAAELLEARDGVLRLLATVPMTPVEQAAAEGDAARLGERLAALQGVPPPEPPGAAFVFNPAPGAAATPPPAEPDTAAGRRQALDERLATARRDLALAEQAGKRPVLVRALRNEIAVLEADLAAAGRGQPAELIQPPARAHGGAHAPEGAPPPQGRR